MTSERVGLKLVVKCSAPTSFEKTGTHEWVKDFRPWNENKDKRHKCNAYCDHHVHYIECLCGEVRKATVEEFTAAEEKSDGY